MALGEDVQGDRTRQQGDGHEDEAVLAATSRDATSGDSRLMQAADAGDKGEGAPSAAAGGSVPAGAVAAEKPSATAEPQAAAAAAGGGSESIDRQPSPAAVAALKARAAAASGKQDAARPPSSAKPISPAPNELAKASPARPQEGATRLDEDVAASNDDSSLIEMICTTGETKQLSVMGELGFGTSGHVYKVLDQESHHFYAVKLSQTYSEYTAAGGNGRKGWPEEQEHFEAVVTESFQHQEQLLHEGRKATRYVVECYARGFVQQKEGIRQALLLELGDGNLQAAIQAPVKESTARRHMEQVRCKEDSWEGYSGVSARVSSTSHENSIESGTGKEVFALTASQHVITLSSADC